MDIMRGDVYLADLSSGVGSEQAGKRPVLIIQNDVGNKFSPTVIVASITTKSKNKLPTHVEISLSTPSTVMLEQIRTIDKKRIISYIESVKMSDMRKVDEALLTSIGIKH
jgi:mRNA interferase MazF